MENLRDLQEEARSLERAGRDAAAADLYDRILSDPAGARLGGMWAARARHRLRAGDVAAAAADMAASAERYETAGLKNLSLAQWRGALQAHAEGPAEWVLRSARVAMAEGYLRDARRGYAAFADRAEAAGRTEEAVQALREYLAAAPDDSAARRRLSALTGEPEPEPAASPVLEPARPEPEAEHAVADPLPGLVPTAPADTVVADPDEDPGEVPVPPIGLLDGFEPTAAASSPPHDPVEETAAAHVDEPEEVAADPTEELEPLPLLGARQVDTDDEAEELDTPPESDPEPLPLLGFDHPAEEHRTEDVGDPPPTPDAAQHEYVDFGAMVLADAPGEETRFQVAIGDPTGDEENDFAEILDLFRRNVSERLDPRDAASHYDLGLAFKQMGLLDDAIIHLQNGLRGGADPLATLEVLGECFVLRGQVSLAARVFDRATRLEGVEEGELVGVLYGLARCQEEMGQGEPARATLERVVGVDLSFRDAADRLRRLQSR